MVPLYRFVALRVFGAVVLVVLAERAAEHWLQAGPVAQLGLILTSCALILVAFHALVGRRLWALVRANQRLAAGDLTAAALPVPRVRDEIDLVLAWRSHMLQRLVETARENARLYAQTDQSLHQRLRELEVLYAVTRALVAAPNLDATLALILDRLAEVAGAQRAAVLLLDSPTGRLEVRMAHQMPPDAWPALAADLSRLLVQRDQETGALSLACDPLVVGASGGDRAHLCFPLQSAGHPIGGIYLDRAEAGGFAMETVRLIAALADDCALAIERAQLAQMAASAEAYRQADALKSEFLAAVSHDLRTPLTFIYGTAELLTNRAFAEDQRQALLGEVLAQAKRMAAMIDDLLDLARLEAGRLELRPEPLDVRALLDEVAALFGERSAKHRLVVETVPSLPAVAADRRRLQQVIENLVGNAIRYSPGGGTVTLRAMPAGNQVAIDVEDQGIGIPAEELPRIFDRFYRVRSAATAAITGTGLGLAIVEGLVRALGGAVDVRSRVGEGSVFRVTLPADTA
ncbi:MAG: GAF domain-containing protein [Chloroflexi bacterium]|nr:GAF domain-containing protein [Chloroflexota bacterium]